MTRGHLILLLISTAFTTVAQPVAILPCKTWGQPDWTRYEDHLAKTGVVKTGARVREYDQNIRSVSLKQGLQSFNGKVYLRWLLQDTTIYYDIRLISEASQEILYQVTSNQCGLILPLNSFNGTEDDVLSVHVSRNHKYLDGGGSGGVMFSLRQLHSAERKPIENELRRLQFNDPDKPFTLVDFYIEKKLLLDALTTLERLLEKVPGNSIVVKKYWDTVNEAHIDKW